MERDERFKRFYNEILKEEKNLEEMRVLVKKELNTNKIIRILGGLISMSIILLLPILSTLNISINSIMVILCLISIIIVIGIYIIIGKHTKDKAKERKEAYTKEYKEKIIKPLIEVFDNEIEYYNMDKGIEKSEYDLAEFCKYDKYNSKDYIKGKLESGEEFILSNVYSASINETEGTYYNVFSGLFGKIKIKQSFNNNLYLRDGKYKLIFEKNLFKDTKTKVNSEEFEKYFDVYCSDNEIVSKLFTNEMIEFMIKFRKELNNRCELTLKNNCIYIRIAVDEIFEGPLEQLALDENILYKYYKIMDSCLKIMNMVVRELS